MLSAHIFCVNFEMLSVFAYFMLILIQILKCSILIHFLVNLDFEMLSVFTQFTLLPLSLCCMSRLFEKPTFHIYAPSRMTSFSNLICQMLSNFSAMSMSRLFEKPSFSYFCSFQNDFAKTSFLQSCQHRNMINLVNLNITANTSLTNTQQFISWR